MTDQSRCPRCGGALVPVLVADPRSGEGDLPLLADPPVRVVCPACDPTPTPVDGFTT
ncbi:hypothetical protein [Nocardioides dongxiaopingii]|uniref:hypothetical protein n=1 Tax=Nocardioides TaxID=1839 RepID=UPI0014858AA2|nr:MULTISPECIES: hypothetical protein [Nocardioides]